MDQIKERPTIGLMPVTSSQIESIGHHPETNTLAVKFPSNSRQPDGSLYHYQNFTKDDYLAFMTADSKGSHFKKFIRNEVAKHPYTKIQ